MNYVKFCPICASINFKSEDIEQSEIKDVFYYKNNHCCECGGDLFETDISTQDYYENVFKKLNTQKSNREILNKFIRPLNMLENHSNVYMNNMLKYYGINLFGTKEFIPNAPMCPTCHSTEIRDITGGERFINALFFGLFGNKRKKRFECQNCKYQW